MNKIILPVFCITTTIFSIMAQNAASIISYPTTKKENISDDYFGTVINDPYRWLENDTATEVINWVKEQNAVTQNYLQQIPYRDDIKMRLTKIWDYPKYSSPFKEGDWYYFFKNNGLQNQSVLYRQKTLQGESEVFLNPNTLSKDGTASLSGINFSKNHQYCAVRIAVSGSDWNEIIVFNTATKKPLSDTLKWVKFSSATWHGNGFYYSRYDEPVKGKGFSNQNEFMKIYYHKLGTPQSGDKLIYEDREHPLRYFNAAISEDEKYLYIYVSEGTSGNAILIKDLSKNESDFRPLFDGFEYNYSIIDNVGETLLVHTDNNAPNYKLMAVNANNTAEKNWKTIIPENEHLLDAVSHWKGQLFANYLENVSSKIYKFSLDGTREETIQLPGIGTATGFYGKESDTETFYTFSSFTNPGEIYHYNLITGKATLFQKTQVQFNSDDFETHQVFYRSKDGTKVPMFIIYKKGIERNGKNPALLYGYGGFNISLTPSFSISRILFLEQGGVMAIANLRGGGEYGEAWHKAGMLANKQNVFDDFIAAAEYLIDEKYTSNQYLGIQGGSNGGLLVGACMTQRPDLFKVAIPQVGVLDMLRYHKFTIGWGWAVEYGSSENKEALDYLIQYSPLHRVKKDVNYPATLIMTADHDDRVVPAHSFKFAAELQSKQDMKGNPVLIRVDYKAGHGAGKPTAKLIDDATDLWSFLLWNTGVKELKNDIERY